MEEPPTGALILIISHHPQRVLPTIRSRCRRLLLPALSNPEVAVVLDGLGLDGEAASREAREAAAARSGGSVAKALRLLERRTLSLVEDAEAILDGLPAVPDRRVLALGERLGARGGEGDLALVLDLVLAWAERRVAMGAGLGPARLAPLAEVCEKLTEAARAVETYNLDRRPFVISMFDDLAEAVRRAA